MGHLGRGQRTGRLGGRPAGACRSGCSTSASRSRWVAVDDRPARPADRCHRAARPGSGSNRAGCCVVLGRRRVVGHRQALDPGHGGGQAARLGVPARVVQQQALDQPAGRGSGPPARPRRAAPDSSSARGRPQPARVLRPLPPAMLACQVGDGSSGPERDAVLGQRAQPTARRRTPAQPPISTLSILRPTTDDAGSADPWGVDIPWVGEILQVGNAAATITGDPRAQAPVRPPGLRRPAGRPAASRRRAAQGGAVRPDPPGRGHPLDARGAQARPDGRRGTDRRAAGPAGGSPSSTSSGPLTYAQLDADSNALARAWAQRGLGPSR